MIVSSRIEEVAAVIIQKQNKESFEFFKAKLASFPKVIRTMNSSWIEEAHAYNMESDADEVSLTIKLFRKFSVNCETNIERINLNLICDSS